MSGLSAVKDNRSCKLPISRERAVGVVCDAKSGNVGGETYYLNTPFFKSVPMSQALGTDVWIKMDCMQPSGSYKLRGVSITCLRARERGATRLVSSSGGNAGLAVAYTGQQMGMPVTVVLPESTPEFVKDRLEGYGADVEVYGAMWADANDRAVELAEEVGGSLIHPFDMQDLWDGHASIVHEIKDDLEEPPDAVIVSVGGGGLLMGVLTGLQQVGWDQSVVTVACETNGADCLAKSVAAGEVITLPGITSIAKSLGAASPSSVVYDRCVELGPSLVSNWVCSDKEAVQAVIRFAEEHRVLVEPACGAALAAVYQSAQGLKTMKSVVVEVCGGAIVGPELLEQWRKDFKL